MVGWVDVGEPGSPGAQDSILGPREGSASLEGTIHHLIQKRARRFVTRKVKKLAATGAASIRIAGRDPTDYRVQASMRDFTLAGISTVAVPSAGAPGFSMSSSTRLGSPDSGVTTTTTFAVPLKFEARTLTV